MDDQAADTAQTSDSNLMSSHPPPVAPLFEPKRSAQNASKTLPAPDSSNPIRTEMVINATMPGSRRVDRLEIRSAPSDDKEVDAAAMVERARKINANVKS